MLALDSSIGCIVASEPDVLALYRSEPLLAAKVAGTKPESREAYVCAIRKNSRAQVYVALVSDNKRIFVYTRSGEPDAEDNYDGTLREALEFTRSMGFDPALVNLNYGAAMREVVLRDIKILRPPGSKVHTFLKHGLADTRPPAATITPAAHKKPSPVASPVVSKETTTIAAAVVVAVAAEPVQPSDGQELAALRGALSRMTGENRLQHERASQEAASLREKLAKALSDSEREREQLAQVRADLLIGQNAQEKAFDEALGNLKGELKTLTAARDAHSMTVQELSTLRQAADAELAAEREDGSRVASERDALAQRIEAVEATSSDLASLRREVAMLSGERDEAKQREHKLAAESAAYAEALSNLKGELGTLAAVRDTQSVTVQELSALRQAADAELATAREDRFRLSAERDALALRIEAIEATSCDLVSLQREVAQLSGERDEANLRELGLAAESAARAEALSAAREEIAELVLKRAATQKRAEQLAEENGISIAESEALHGELVTLSAQREAALRRADMLERESLARGAELESLRGELAALAAEREMLRKRGESPLAEETTDAQPAISRLRPEAVEFPEAREWISWPAAGKPPEVAKELREAPGPIPQWQPNAEFEENAAAAPLAKLPEPPLFSDPDDDFFPSEEALAACPGRFLLQAGLTAIEYGSPEDVEELHQSVNLAHLSPEGKGQESCQGYICCLGKAGSRQVFAALFGTKSGRTWVYLPEVQPGDGPEYDSAVRGAIDFAEAVGFIMEPVQLGTARRQHNKAVTHCPVLKCADLK